MIIKLRNGQGFDNKKCTIMCDYCGNKLDRTYIKVIRAKHHFCDINCRNEWEKDITHHPAWKGGQIKRLGYVFIKVKDHPHADILGYVKRSRLVMENHIGRYLTPNETIHHKNFDREDDRIENLELFSNIGEHTRFHALCRNY